MNDFQKWGGISALGAAATYVVGFALMIAVLMPAGFGSGEGDPAQSAAFLAENQTMMYTWNLIIYVINSVFLVVLALALFDRLKGGPKVLAQTGTAFGLIWAGLVLASGMLANISLGAIVDLFAKDPDQAGSLWLALSTVEQGIGGGNEIAGGLWILLISLAALRAAQLPKLLNFLGVLIGVAGLLTIIPALGEAGGSVFGLGFIVWFVWVGIAMLRTKTLEAA